MSDLSFKGFAIAKGFSLPVSAKAVAKSLGMNPPPPPISMRAMIATAAPLVPANLSYNPGVSWWDQAALPPWLQPPYPDPIRAATSFEIKFWQGQPSTGEVLVIDVTLPLSSVISSSGGTSIGMYYYPGVLDGIYTFQITAINPFGSASTSAVSEMFTPPAGSPNITVTRSPASPNLYSITGTGFEAYNGQSVTVEADVGVGSPASPSLRKVVVVVVNNGGFAISSFSVAGICGSAAGGSGSPLRFYVLQTINSPGAISNIVTGLTCD
jgi:hypothetical protein